jgi:hypothetical protein
LLNWFSGTPKYICFEDMLIATCKPGEYIIINTLPNSDQSCLIKGTCPIGDEEHTINKIISKYTNQCLQATKHLTQKTCLTLKQ